MRRLWENIFGLDRGFLTRDGDLSIGFNPAWPVDPAVNAGAWNWLIAAIVLAGLIYLLTRLRDDAMPRDARRHVGAVAGVIAFFTFAAISFWAAIAIAALVFAIEWLTRWTVRLWAARLLLVAILFTLLSGTLAFNVGLSAVAAGVLLYVYPREGRATRVRLSLAIVRASVLAFVIALLNRPVLNLSQDLVDPSVVAILVDDSISMSVKDVRPDAPASSPTRLEAVINLLAGPDQALVQKLAARHQVRVYGFDGTARQKGPVVGDGKEVASNGSPSALPTMPAGLAEVLRGMKPDGQSTAVVPSLIGVLEELQGQRLAGIVVLTDGVETVPGQVDESLKALRAFHANVYPVAVGSEKAPTNIEVQAVNVQDAVFVDDLVLLKATVRGSGYPANHPVKVMLKSTTGAPLKTADGKPVEQMVNLPDDKPVEVELAFKPDQVGTLDLQTIAEPQPGEIDARDNIRPSQIAVLDAKINVLYVDGYPRWEYRYLKNEMIRDKTVNLSCLLTSADPTFAQEGDEPDPPSGADRGSKFPGPIKRFPETIEELMKFDAVVFGDVDPRQFSDRQLQLVNEFVSKKGGGFGMVAGPRWSPQAYRNSPIEAIVPVTLARTRTDVDPAGVITEGFRPIVTKAGSASSVFRFFADRAQNDAYIANKIEPLFWYCRGVSAKPGVGEVYAEHPVETGPDGRKAPLLVLGRYGAGRTLFSAIDDSWRWRFYTGESIFDTYWIQQLRHLARSRKLGQRHLNFNSDRETYTLGEPVRLELNVLDPVLSQQLSREIAVEVKDEAGQVIRREQLQRQESPPDSFAVSFPADRVGRYTVNLPALGPAGASEPAVSVPFETIVPRLELAKPAVNLPLLKQIATADEKTGQPAVFDLASAAKLPDLIRSAARTIPKTTAEPLWDAPLSFLIFMGLLTTEWVVRKMNGMM